MEEDNINLDKKWEHVKNYKFLKHLINDNNDLLIFGQVNSGKTDIINDLLKKKNIKINISLLMNKNIGSILNKISFYLSSYFNIEIKQTDRQKDSNEINWNKFLNEIRIYKDNPINNLKEHMLKFTVVFEDCQNFSKKNLNNSHINLLSKLFKSLNSFRKVAKINIKYIFISRRYVNLNCSKFFINYPSQEELPKLFMNKILKIFIESKVKITKSRCSIIQIFLNKIINNFNLIVKNYQTTKLILILFAGFFIKNLNNLQEENDKEFYKYFIELFNSKKIIILKNILIYNPNYAYKPQKLIEHYVNNLNDIIIGTGKDISVNNIKNLIFEKELDKLSIIPSIILIALYLGSKTSKGYDKSTFTDYKKNKKRNKKNSKIKLNMKSSISLNRLIGIFQILLNEYLKNNDKKIENLNSFQSNEFFVNIVFLENIRLINKLTLFNDETSNIRIEYIGNKEQIEYLAKEYNIDLKMYIKS